MLRGLTAFPSLARRSEQAEGSRTIDWAIGGGPERPRELFDKKVNTVLSTIRVESETGHSLGRTSKAKTQERCLPNSTEAIAKRARVEKVPPRAQAEEFLYQQKRGDERGRKKDMVLGRPRINQVGRTIAQGRKGNPTRWKGGEPGFIASSIKGRS